MVRPFGAALSLLLAVTGCSAAPPAPAPPAASLGLTGARARSALLTPTDVGARFRASRLASASTPLPCEPRRPPLDRRFAPAVRVGAEWSRRDGMAELSEEIVGYASPALAEAALDAGERGLSCGSATTMVDGIVRDYVIAGPRVLTSTLRGAVDRCEAWTVHTDGAAIELVVARVGALLVVLTAGAAPAATELPDMTTVLRRAVTKVRAAR